MSPRDTVGIIIRLFTKTDSPLAAPLTLVIIRRSMIDTAIVPDGHVVGILQSETYLKVMVLGQ